MKKMAFFPLSLFNGMIKGRYDKGGLAIAVAAVVAGISMVFLLYAWSFDAEAAGNLTNTENPHNLSAGSAGVAAVSETRICIFCHTPHHAIQDAALLGSPLWNHTLSEASYDLSALGTFFINAADITVDGASKLCLSCHDGTVAVGALGSGAIAMVDGACLLADGRIDPTCSVYAGTTPPHYAFSVPINQQLIDDTTARCVASNGTVYRVRYPWQVTGDGPANAGVVLFPTAQTYSGNPGVTTPTAPAPPYKAGNSYGVQCNSCHDPHYYHKSGADSCKFMTGGSCIDNYAPLCLACHSRDC